MQAQSSGWIARVHARAGEARRISDALSECIDAADAAVSFFESAPATWSVEIHFADKPDLPALRLLVAAIAGDEAAASLTLQRLEIRDWVAESLQGLAPVRAGRFIVHGAHDRARLPASGVKIEIQAAQAFGTGHHATTRGCLLALNALLVRQKRKPAKRRVYKRQGVLDVGTGTGVLAIAAARTLRQPVLASDIDRVATETARANARSNGVGPFVQTIKAAGVTDRAFRRHRPYAIVFANILLTPVMRLASPLARVASPQTIFVLSGLLKSQANAALAAYRHQGLHLVRRIDLDGWTILTVARGGVGPRRKIRPGRVYLPGR